MKIKTKILKEMINKSIKGAGMNKMLPLTGYLGIELKDNLLTLITTDGNNYLRVLNKVEVDGVNDNFYTVVKVDIFSKLINKTTKEYIELINTDNFLNLKGNGIYKLEIPISEDGNIIKYPNHIDKFTNIEAKKINIKLLQKLLDSAKNSIAIPLVNPCLTGYYIGNKIITTDTQKICYINQNIIDTDLLISSDLASLINLLDEQEANIYIIDNNIMIETNNIIITSKELEGKDVFPMEPINLLVNTTYENRIKLNKNELLDILDRMSLFAVEEYKKSISFEINNNEVKIISQESKAEEIITILDSTNIINFKFLINIDMLKDQLLSIVSDKVDLYYGSDSSIKLVEDNMILITALENS